MPEPWERREDESDQAWTAFVEYRDMGSVRSLANVGQKLGYADRSLMSRWSAQYDWRARVRAWDAEQDRTRREEHLDEIATMSRRHAQVAQASIQALTAPIHQLIDEVRDDPGAVKAKIKKLPLEERLELIGRIARVLPGLVNMERLSRGVPTEITKIEDPGADARELERRLSFAQRVRDDPEAREALGTLLEHLYGPDDAGHAGPSGGESSGASDPHDEAEGGTVDDGPPSEDPRPGDS